MAVGVLDGLAGAVLARRGDGVDHRVDVVLGVRGDVRARVAPRLAGLERRVLVAALLGRRALDVRALVVAHRDVRERLVARVGDREAEAQAVAGVGDRGAGLDHVDPPSRRVLTTVQTTASPAPTVTASGPEPAAEPAAVAPLRQSIELTYSPRPTVPFASSATVWLPVGTSTAPVVPAFPTAAALTAPSIVRSKRPASVAGRRSLTTVRVPRLRVFVMTQVQASPLPTLSDSWPADALETVALPGAEQSTRLS